MKCIRYLSVGKMNHKEDEIYPKVEGMYLSLDEM
jgi:hypothetical protein